MDQESLEREALSSIQVHFHRLITKRANGLVERNDLALPELGELKASACAMEWFPIPGMYGGFAYRLDNSGSEIKLIAESWCRMDGGSGQRHEITAGGCKLVAEGFV